MASIEFREVDIYGTPALKDRVAELVSRELGGNRSTETILETINYHSGGTTVLGGFVDGQLVSMNAFMKTTFHRSNGDSVIGYQSGFSATDAGHRGKGYWPKLLTFAEQHLARSGVLIYGFPNPASHPLFVKKLGYQEVDLYNLKIFHFPFLFGRMFGKEKSGQVAMLPDFDEIVAWKKAIHGDDLIVVRSGSSRIWGVKRSITKFGIPLNFVEIGSFEISSDDDLKDLFLKIAKSSGVRISYVSMNPMNSYSDRLVFKTYGQPVIVKGLGGFDALGEGITFFGGMRDTF